VQISQGPVCQAPQAFEITEDIDYWESVEALPQWELLQVYTPGLLVIF
jgi:hypothetical protein